MGVGELTRFPLLVDLDEYPGDKRLDRRLVHEDAHESTAPAHPLIQSRDRVGRAQLAIDGSDMRTAVHDAVRARWTRTLARDFHHWPHRTRCAAVAVVHAAQLADDLAKYHGAVVGADFDPILEQVRTWAANGAATLYTDRWSTSQDLSSDELPGDVVALARACGGPMHKSQLLALIREHMDEARRGGERVPADPEQWMQGLAHGGIIEPIIPETAGDSAGETIIASSHYRIAIPSMAAHIEANTVAPADPAQIQRAKDAIQPRRKIVTEELIRQAAARRARDAVPPEQWETAALPIRDRPFALPAGPAAAGDADTDG